MPRLPAGGSGAWLAGSARGFARAKGRGVRRNEAGNWILANDADPGKAWRQLVHLGDTGRGVNRQRVDLGTRAGV